MMSRGAIGVAVGGTCIVLAVVWKIVASRLAMRAIEAEKRAERDRALLAEQSEGEDAL